ncbi:WhiB family transcriptional regulator [Mycobacterium kyorinense]|uniref:4Fe-4S Wbl-type domain-containing protein n=1 Tax=Mycobacterium kyorinense TaxID=487514 RepID=A0A1X1Y805_9MYCO|nr:WhiB family transcriptional regulator [Mycobacterium kyorinense]ORW07196.1 hypothetical protein AWC14_24975 [Mycobacterium kyorinense]
MNHKRDIAPPPCLQHPGDWFDPTRRALTRQQCLKCPNRAQCSQDALRNRPAYGMWAGVWINDDFNAKQHLLRAHAQPISPTAKHPEPQTISRPVGLIPVHQRTARRSKVGKLITATPLPPIAAQITARASGHCEIMAPACTYQQGAIFSRRRTATRQGPLGSPADAIAACHNCIELIEHTDLPTALDLGYIVDPRTTTSTAPKLWRQHRWVYLDTQGRIHDVTDASIARSA